MQICLDAMSRVLDAKDDDHDAVEFGACDPIWYPGLSSRRDKHYRAEDDDASQADEEERGHDYRAEFGHEADCVWAHDFNSCSYWVEDGATRTIAEGIRWPSHVQSRLGKWTRANRR